MNLPVNQNVILPRHSFIAVIFYQTATSELFIVLRKTGRRYKYKSVPIETYKEIMRSNNKGSYITQYIIHGHYEAVEMNQVPMATLEKIIGRNIYPRPSNESTNLYWLGI
jgi:hypothetical protein